MNDEITNDMGRIRPQSGGAQILGYLSSDRPRSKKRNYGRNSSSKTPLVVLGVVAALILGCLAGLGTGYWLWGYEKPYTVDLKSIQAPDWIEQKFIRKNIFSRHDVTMKRVNNIVIHYVGNPGTSAEANRLYFDSLADQDPQKSGSSSSCHFIVGLEGEILQCIPVSEIAYANAPRNLDTVAVETCHPDESGKYNEATYDSLVKLTAWLCKELELTSDDVIRHYDVNEKGCPRYFVEHEDEWKQFKKDVKKALKELK